MQDGGTQLCGPGDIECSVRCKTSLHLEYHIERNHTPDGIGNKRDSEKRLAAFFAAKECTFDQDWTNRISFQDCKNIEGSSASARPDFHLIQESKRLNAIVLVGNDEYAHRRNACDFQRTFNIANSLEQTPGFRGVPLLYIRFNPHHYVRDGTHFSQTLAAGHDLLWKTLKSISKRDLIPGVNLVYINYDRTGDTLHIFQNPDAESYVGLYQPCVLRIV
jgi:hypothetical protein